MVEGNQKQSQRGNTREGGVDERGSGDGATHKTRGTGGQGLAITAAVENGHGDEGEMGTEHLSRTKQENERDSINARKRYQGGAARESATTERNYQAKQAAGRELSRETEEKVRNRHD